MSASLPPDEDRRQAKRRAVRLLVELQHGTGRTIDISSSGVFFETDRAFTLGEPISLAVMLTDVHPMPPIRLRCEGRIVRVERRDNLIGVAVAISSSQAETADSAGADTEDEA